ncbi:hypothetical protein ACFOWM_13230 [Ferruginibacter yonginensis]|uniref:HEAT repeat domain-containing protein n=1 Tax=Ferruginibacter yonginensis TaxID=1310416 RepID=A0ABV8QVE6_9BACT
MSRKNWTDEKLFFRLVNNKSDKTYWDNIRTLRSRANANNFNTCVKQIKSSKPKERIIGIDILAQLGLTPRPFFKESRKLFFDILKKEKDPKVLLSVLYAIGHNNEKLKSDEIALLVSFKDNANEGVRDGLVSALLSVDNKLAIDTLIHLTNDKASHIRDWATFGIGTQIERDNKIIREALWSRVDDKHQDTKLEAIVGLAKRKDLRIKEVIKRELLDGEFGKLIFESIEELNDKDFLPLLKDNLKKAKKDKGIKPDWIKDLIDCITQLEKN